MICRLPEPITYHEEVHYHAAIYLIPYRINRVEHIQMNIAMFLAAAAVFIFMYRLIHASKHPLFVPTNNDRSEL